MKKQNFRSDIGFGVFDTDYSFSDINYTIEDIDYTTEDIWFNTAYKGYGMLAAPEAVSLQLACRTGPRPSGFPPILRAPFTILPSFPYLFGFFIFTQSVLGRAGSGKTGNSPYSTPIFTI